MLERLFILGACDAFRSAPPDTMFPVGTVFVPVDGAVVGNASPKMGMRENERINEWYILGAGPRLRSE